jgi:catechol 2,3-dioxygenase-like lactoylglutathione lyase family enzyme
MLARIYLPGIVMRNLLVVSCLLMAALLVRLSLAQDRGVRGLNHVGLVVANYDAAFDYYNKKMGFREAYTVRNEDGSVRLTYLQLSRETFLELIPAAPGQATGITHFGVEMADLDAKVADLRAHGVEVADPSLTPAKAKFTRLTDLDGVQIEVMEFGPGSLQRKAMEAWR